MSQSSIMLTIYKMILVTFILSIAIGPGPLIQRSKSKCIAMYWGFVGVAWKTMTGVAVSFVSNLLASQMRSFKPPPFMHKLPSKFMIERSSDKEVGKRT